MTFLEWLKHIEWLRSFKEEQKIINKAMDRFFEEERLILSIKFPPLIYIKK